MPDAFDDLFDLDDISFDQAQREIDTAVAQFVSTRRAQGDETPCDCSLVEVPEVGPHTTRQHAAQSCGGVMRPDPCGGCYDCMEAQWEHAQRIAKLRAEVTDRSDGTFDMNMARQRGLIDGGTMMLAQDANLRGLSDEIDFKLIECIAAQRERLAPDECRVIYTTVGPVRQLLNGYDVWVYAYMICNQGEEGEG